VHLRAVFLFPLPIRAAARPCRGRAAIEEPKGTHDSLAFCGVAATVRVRRTKPRGFPLFPTLRRCPSSAIRPPASGGRPYSCQQRSSHRIASRTTRKCQGPQLSGPKKKKNPNSQGPQLSGIAFHPREK